MRSNAAAPSRGSDPAGRPEGDLASAVAQARSDPALLESVSRLLSRADAATAAAGAACDACGRCCRFEEFGHRLYVTTAELALLTAARAPASAGRGRCPYQLDGRCAARDRRALGCRVFFCRPPGSLAPEDLYEALHAEIRLLHDRHGVAYLYVELTEGLREADGQAARAPTSTC